MNIDEFIERLRQTPRDWRIDQFGRIRIGEGGVNGCQCPISAVDGTPGTHDPCHRAARIGMGPEDAMAIVYAADTDGPDTKNANLRARLLEACGLKEQP